MNDFMGQLGIFLAGKKTYLVGVLLICIAAGFFGAGRIQLTEMMTLIGLGLTAMGLRHGMPPKTAVE